MCSNKFDFDTLPPSSSDSEAPLETPISIRDVRRHIKDLKKTHGALEDKIDLLVRATEKLSIQLDLSQHENVGLRNALTTEQKRRKRGGKMGILDRDEPGQAVFASPANSAAIRARRQEEEAQKKTATKEEKEREKETKAAQKA